jgi:GntR family transcriptional regulator/MocR family aminotransferase
MTGPVGRATTHARVRRAPQGLPLLVALDDDAREPLFRQLYRHLRSAILDGRLAPGLRLPSTRILASDLKISRNTVVATFEQLHAEGYLDSRVGRGTRVAGSVPADHPRLQRQRPAKNRVSTLSALGRASGRAQVIAHAAARKSLLPDRAPAFRPGLPALDEFPIHIWQRTASRCVRALVSDSLAYADSLGYAPLRRVLSQLLATARGIRCTPAQVFIVAGTQEALQLSAQVTLDVGDVAWVEDPGYHGAVGALAAAGARVIPAPVDDEGLDVEAARARAPEARLAYVTPSHQFPLGVTMSLNRRLELLEWARTTGAWIVEDDYDSEFRYVSRPLTALHGLDDAERVIYCGTLSKVLFPSLRLGYVVVPPGLVDLFAAARDAFDIHRATLEQMVLAEFIEDGHFERHIRRMRVLYRERRDALIAALESELGDAVTVGGSDAGMHLVAWLSDDIDAFDVQRRAAARAIDAIPVAAFAMDRSSPPGLVLGYAHLDPARIRQACGQLADIIRTAARIEP